MRTRHVVAGLLALISAVPLAALSHRERPTESPARPGSVPNAGRMPTAVLNVCKTDECTYHHIQAAVNAAPDGALIQIWPGLYNEEPSRAAPEVDDPPETFPNGSVTYEYHVKHPNSHNLIAIIGKHNITLRGIGLGPKDVVIDVAFKKHVGIRGDRADGIVLQNFALYHAYDHGIYVLDTDGYVIDGTYSGFSHEYPYLTFADDHGLMINCEAEGGGDGGIYPGGSAETPGRVSQEISHCRSHHNALGYSGTNGNYVWVHDSEFYDNAAGMTLDSKTNHPNYPQKGLILERNSFHDNNFDVYDASSDIQQTVGGTEILIPVGVGIFLITGDENLVRDNSIWGHDRYGVWLGSGQGMVLGPTSEPMALPITSNGNRFIANRMYDSASPAGTQNGIDFAWDGMGTNNCWERNVRTPEGEPATPNVLPLPPCSTPVLGGEMPFTAGPPNVPNLIEEAGLLYVQGEPLACRIGDCVWGPGPDPKNARNLPEGYRAPASPPPCGPATCGSRARAQVLGGKTVAPAPAPSRPRNLPATGVEGIPAVYGIALIAAAAGAAARLRAVRR